MRKENDAPLHEVNVESGRYLQINNCSLQIRKDGFTVTRSEGWRDWQLLLILSGECIALHNGRQYRMTPGNVLLYAPHEPQIYTFPSECHSLWVHFSGTAIEEILSSCSLKSGVYAIGPDKQFRSMFFAIIQKFHHEKTAKYADAALIELLCYMSDLTFRAESLACPASIMKAVDYITRNFNSDITLAELAAVSGYSKSRFSYLFRYYMEKTPVDYQRSLRLSSAKELLSSTGLSVGEIALACGYSDALYFSRIFRAAYGISPTEFRKKS